MSHNVRTMRGAMHRAFIVWLVSALLAAISSHASDSPLAGYLSHEELTKKLRELDASELATLSSLGKTLGGREVHLLTVGKGKVEEKPAFLIVGNVHAPQVIGSEMAYRMASGLVQKAKTPEVVALLDRFTFYFIPRPNPDATEACFRKPFAERSLNERPMDDDRDGAVNEDPFEDLNGDGFITMLRVENPAGIYRAHPKDDRVLIPAEAKKNERGRYSVYTEGIDNDKDEKFNEDGPGGTSFNRNWTFRYPYFGVGAGPNQVSEIETRAVADFAFKHPNILAVICFAPEDNLSSPWKPEGGAEGRRIKTSVQPGDAPFMDYVSEEYRKIAGIKDAQESARGEGAFGEWAYFHYGRWAFSSRGWRAPKPPSMDSKKEEDKSKPAPATSPPPAAKKEETPKAEFKSEGAEKRFPRRAGADKGVARDREAEEKRGEEMVSALAWFKQEKIDAFVPWKPIQHPDFPGKKVEVGGMKPFYLWNPPARMLDELGEKHAAFLLRLAALAPRIEISETKVEKLGGGVYRVTVQALNAGYLPTMSQMGRIAGDLHHLQWSIALPKEVTILQGVARPRVEPLEGSGGSAKYSWVLRRTGAGPASIPIKLYSPSTGTVTKSVTLD